MKRHPPRSVPDGTGRRKRRLDRRIKDARKSKRQKERAKAEKAEIERAEREAELHALGTIDDLT